MVGIPWLGDLRVGDLRVGDLGDFDERDGGTEHPMQLA
jgi:hypothetical protein